jgi:enoyl-CoA hydratase/carnithine racemase
MADDESILYTKENGIGILTLNRPEKMNSCTAEMSSRMWEITDEASYDDEVRAFVITGAGRAFCGGADVSRLGQPPSGRTQQRPQPPAERPPNPLPRWAFARMPKPTIAAVNGPAAGMGAEFVAGCDIRIASEHARFGWVFSQRGLVPDIGTGPFLLPYIVGLSKALELMYTGEMIDAQEALRIGLVSKVVPADQLLPEVKKLAAKIMKSAPLAIKGVKELTYGAFGMQPNAHQEWVHKLFLASNQTEDTREGIRAFIEKRPPVWKGK